MLSLSLFLIESNLANRKGEFSLEEARNEQSPGLAEHGSRIEQNSIGIFVGLAQFGDLQLLVSLF